MGIWMWASGLDPGRYRVMIRADLDSTACDTNAGCGSDMRDGYSERMRLEISGPKIRVRTSAVFRWYVAWPSST